MSTYNLSQKETEQNLDTIVDIENQQNKCRTCDGSECIIGTDGFIPHIVSENGRFHQAYGLCRRERQKREAKKIERLVASAAIPPRYKNLGWGDYRITSDNMRAVDMMKKATKQSNGLYIYGNRGSGKTMLASIFCNEKAKAGQSVLFISMIDLIADIKASFKNENTEEVMDAVKNVPCIVLDDVGTERMTAWVAEQIFAILNHRYNNQLQTIITSNYDLMQMAQRLSVDGDDIIGQRIVSRINGMCFIVSVDGEDQRRSVV